MKRKSRKERTILLSPHDTPDSSTYVKLDFTAGWCSLHSGDGKIPLGRSPTSHRLWGAEPSSAWLFQGRGGSFIKANQDVCKIYSFTLRWDCLGLHWFMPAVVLNSILFILNVLKWKMIYLPLRRTVPAWERGHSPGGRRKRGLWMWSPGKRAECSEGAGHRFASTSASVGVSWAFGGEVLSPKSGQGGLSSCFWDL